MGKTWSCDLDGCAMVFSKAYELRKHKIEHEDADRLFYCKCAGCNFYNLDPRNLVVHFVTNDRSLLTKHRKRAHAYILRLRAPYKGAWTFESVYYNTPPSPGSTSACATTGNATPRAIKAESAEERTIATQKSLKSSLPRATPADNRVTRGDRSGPTSAVS